MTVSRPPLLLAIAVACAITFAAACSGDDGAAATATPTAEVTEAGSTATPSLEDASPTVTASPSTAAGTPTTIPPADRAEAPDVANVMAHIAALASDIGVRSAGTEAEDEAAAYIAGVLQDAGYETAIEPFPVSTRIDGSSIAVENEDIAVRPLMMEGSATGEAGGALVYGALGSAEDLAGLDVTGRVLLLDRGVVPFGVKARNAELAGAVAVVIANNEDGPYNGSLGGRPATIPVLAVSGAEGESLRPLADAGAIATVRASIDAIEGESQNVVGRSGDTCRFYIGGHYDSVPQGPGANDNASGTAVALELARVHRTDGLCVIAFGAEEIGLFGSEAYVAQHGVADALFMLNFDMTGRLDDALIIGDAALTSLLLDVVEEAPIRSGQFPPFASSDHVSFLDAGVAAVTITSGDDPLIHTAGDDVDNVSTESLATMLAFGDRALSAALAAVG